MADRAVARQEFSAAGFTGVTVQGLDGVMDRGTEPGAAHDLVLGLLSWLLEGRRRRTPPRTDRPASDHGSRPAGGIHPGRPSCPACTTDATPLLR